MLRFVARAKLRILIAEESVIANTKRGISNSFILLAFRDTKI